MTRLFTIIPLIVAMGLATPAWSYDAATAGMALRHIGFENIYMLKGGFKALTSYMGPSEANAPLKQVESMRKSYGFNSNAMWH